MEDTFPWAFIDRVKPARNSEVVAEAVQINELNQGEDYGYAVIIDRISQDVPFIELILKMQRLTELTSSTILLVECRRKIL